MWVVRGRGKNILYLCATEPVKEHYGPGINQFHWVGEGPSWQIKDKYGIFSNLKYSDYPIKVDKNTFIRN